MAYQSGHGGTVTGLGYISGDVRTWELTDFAQVHDITVVSDTVRSRLGGIPDWSANLNFLLSASSSMSATNVKPGDTVSLALTALPGETGTYSGTGIIQDVRMKRDPNREIDGTMIVLGNSALTRPDNAP